MAAARERVERLLQANVYNGLIGGTGAHAKNYSLRISAGRPGGQVRLAPLYELSSQLPYRERIPPRVAIKIGKHYDVALIDATDWRRLARGCHLQEEWVLGRSKRWPVTCQ